MCWYIYMLVVSQCFAILMSFLLCLFAVGTQAVQLMSEKVRLEICSLFWIYCWRGGPRQVSRRQWMTLELWNMV